VDPRRRRGEPRVEPGLRPVLHRGQLCPGTREARLPGLSLRRRSGGS
jgi:hypothetical protein